MRKKKEKHEEPTYTKGSTRNKHKSKTQHSIIHKHEQKMQEFKNKEQRILQIDSKVHSLNSELDELRKETSFKALNSQSCDVLSTQISKLERQVSELLASRQVIASGQDEVQYLLESSDLVMRYAELEMKEAEILVKPKLDENDTEVVNNIQGEKADIVDSYLKKFEENYISYRDMFDTRSSICDNCDVPLEYDDGFLVCPVCGLCKTTIEHSGELSYKEMQDYDYRPQFTYDKMTHLEDWLRRFQAKEHRVIPQKVLDLVIIEAKKERVKDLTMLTEEKVKRYLKKLGLNEYYDNVIGIINRINGRPPFTLTAEIEDKIKSMFQQLQEPYERHKPKNRKNFLSYSYTLHKIFQILGLHEFSKYFPLLKSADKLRQQDDIFKKIVSEMATKDRTVNWVFYPSI